MGFGRTLGWVPFHWFDLSRFPRIGLPMTDCTLSQRLRRPIDDPVVSDLLSPLEEDKPTVFSIENLAISYEGWPFSSILPVNLTRVKVGTVIPVPRVISWRLKFLSGYHPDYLFLSDSFDLVFRFCVFPTRRLAGTTVQRRFVVRYTRRPLAPLLYRVSFTCPGPLRAHSRLLEARLVRSYSHSHFLLFFYVTIDFVCDFHEPGNGLS